MGSRFGGAVKIRSNFADISNVSAYVSGDASISDVFRSRLTALVQGFDRDARANRMRIRELLESDPESFYSGAIAILKKADDSRGSQYLVELLVSYNLLLRALCDPEFTREQCKQVASLRLASILWRMSRWPDNWRMARPYRRAPCAPRKPVA